MEKSLYSVKIDKKLLKDLKKFCEEKGYLQGSFVSKALREQMEREETKEDIYDLVQLRSQESLAQPFRSYDRSRK